MNKRFRLIKSKIATILVVLMCINSFAAVVGDNDGAAFITKAEFESLKNDFQTQINRYNTSLDSKIDGAIANYVQGITMSATKVIKLLIGSYSDIKWVNGYFEKWVENKVATGATVPIEDSVKWRRPHWAKRRTLRGQNFAVSFGLQSQTNVAVFTNLFHVDNGNSLICPGWSGYQNGRQLAVNFIELRKDNKENWTTLGKNGEYKIGWENNMSHYFSGAIITVGYHPQDQSLYYWGKAYGPVQPEGGAYNWYAWYGWGYGTNYFVGFVNDGTDGLGWYSDPTGKNYGYVRGSVSQLEKPIDTGTRRVFYLNYPLNVANTNMWSPNTDWTYAQDMFGYFDGNSAWGWNKCTVQNTRDSNLLSDLTETYPVDDTQQVATNNLHKNFLLGQDDSNYLNVGYRIDTSESVLGSSYRYDWTSSEYVPTEVTQMKTVVASDKWAGSLTSQEIASNSLIVANYLDGTHLDNINIPLWPRIKTGELPNGNTYYNGSPLKIGQGLPITGELTDAGTITMKLKYDVKDVDITNTTTPSQKVKVYVKNNDFTTNTSSDYYTDISTSTNRSLNGIELEADKETTFKFEVKKGDSVFMRLSPYDTAPSGLYGEITGLDLTIETS